MLEYCQDNDSSNSDDRQRTPRPLGPPARVVYVGPDSAAASEHALLLAAGGEPDLRRGEVTGGQGSGDREGAVHRQASADRLSHLRQGEPRPEGVVGLTAAT